MRFLVIGLGSMGKRRVRNLLVLNEKDIVGFDLREDRRKETEKQYGIRTFDIFEETMDAEPDVFIISTPPDKHLEYQRKAIEHKKHFFCEAGVFPEKLDWIINESKKRRIIAAPSQTMRFYPAMKMIKAFIDSDKIGKPVSFNYHCGNYLPNWHPWENIRNFYVSKRTTGGAREMVAFEMCWIHWLFGQVEEVACIKDRIGNFDADIDDSYHIISRFRNGMLANILVDVVVRPAMHYVTVMGDRGTLRWDFYSDAVTVYQDNEEPENYLVNSKESVSGYKVSDEMYIEEMKNFIKAIKGEIDYGYSYEDEKEAIRFLLAAEKSAETGSFVRI